MKPQIVVTGCNGFIGTNVVDALLKANPSEFLEDEKSSPQSYFDLIVGTDLDRTLANANASRFMRSSRFQFVPHTDLCDYIAKMETLPLAVIHNGACSSTTETDPEVFRTLNLEYTQNLWNICAKQNIPFIYASSAAVYGDGKKGFSDAKHKTKDYTSLNLYGKSKLDFDKWALEQKNTPPYWFGLRYFNVYGPFEAHKGGQASMVFHGYNQATRTGKIKLFKSNEAAYKDGEQVRDFVFVKDIVEVTLKLLKLCYNKQKVEGNGCFVNIGCGHARTWNDLAKNVFESLSIPQNIEYIAMPDNLKNQYQNYTCAELGGLKQLGIEHQFTSLEDGVKTYIQKYLLRGL